MGIVPDGEGWGKSGGGSLSRNWQMIYTHSRKDEEGRAESFSAFWKAHWQIDFSIQPAMPVETLHVDGKT